MYHSNFSSDSLYGLVKVLEEMLFSIPLPSEILRKYIKMRETSFRKVGIDETSD